MTGISSQRVEKAAGGPFPAVRIDPKRPSCVCAVLAVLLFAVALPDVARAHAAWYATASSEWGPDYGAAQAADGVADANGNYWQTVKGKDKGAWWQIDLRQPVTIPAVTVAWARWEDKIHCPPARIVVQTSPTGEANSWQEVLSIGPGQIPRDGEPYSDDPDRQWRYPLKTPATARFLRLVFPDGAQPGARKECLGYLCLGEVEVRTPQQASKIVCLEGPFGKAEVNVARPAMTRLYLRGPEGRLCVRSLLAERPVFVYGYRQGSGMRPWAKQGYTYVVGEGDARYESRSAPPEKVDVREQAGRTVLQITGVTLSDGTATEAAASEDWTLSAPGNGSQLVWNIVRRWKRDFASVMSGSPGLFFGFDARHSKNSVTSTIWYDPFRIAARWSDLYAINMRLPGRVSENRVQTIRDRDTWAVYKLWTDWHAPVDLRLEVAGGHLYRRGSFAYLSEAGAVTSPAAVVRHSKGEVEQITMKIGAVDKSTTGYQLAVTLPDKATETSLRDFYGSVLNGGAVNDQKGFDFGNESDGWYYAGSSWMYGVALAAGVPAAGALSARPYDAARAMREHLGHILATPDEQGRTHFGYNQTGEWVDDNLHTILGTRMYLLHTGDLAFVRQHLPVLERMLAYFVKRRDSRGLFKLAGVGAHWYYDCIRTGGVNSYYNAFIYKAAQDLAEMEQAADRLDQARAYRDLAESIKKAFNAVLWKENAPGGPRYVDWIDANGKEIAYFCDLCQWPPIAVGIASPEQAKKIVATADARIKVLEKQYGYPGFAGLSALWPVSESVTPGSWRSFGTYMNGGSLLCQTYWEILARARAGDREGAARRLCLFARRAAETSWAGNNSADMLGTWGPRNESGEAYLADMVAATAATIHGVLGITPTWDRLEVSPCLPANWPRAEVDLLYKGRRHHVKIEGGKAQIEPREQVIDLPLLWVVDADFKRGLDSVAAASNVDLADGSSVALKKAAPAPGATARYIASGNYVSPIYDWAQAANLKEITVAAELNGGQVTASIETSDDHFKTAPRRVRVEVRDGVTDYPLPFASASSHQVRVVFELKRGTCEDATPVIDAFRIRAEPVP